MSYAIETVKAINRVSLEYSEKLEAAGLNRMFDALRAAAQEDLERIADAEKHPLWVEFTSKIKRQLVTQEFRDAGAAYEALHRTGQAETPEGIAALYLMFKLAPEWLADEFHEIAHSTGLMPEPIGYDDQNQPFYAASDLADKLGITADEVRARAGQLGMPDAGPVIHALQ
jgi:hypothetical protein